MIENPFFWIGLVLSPFILYVEWKILSSILRRGLSSREKLLISMVTIILLLMVMLTVLGYIH